MTTTVAASKRHNHWYIRVDHEANPAKPEGTNENAVGMRSRGCPDDLAGLTLPFRLLNDDGEVVYEGLMVPYEDLAARCSGFEPLDEFGTPNAGCTVLEYFEDGRWKTA